MKRPVILIAAAMLCMLSAALFAFQIPDRIKIDGLSAELIGLTADTEYADDYSHGRFRRIRIGMSEKEVLSILGEPLLRWSPYGYRNTRFPEKAHFVALSYSWSPGSKNYRLRQVILDNGVVAEIRGYFYFD